MPGEDLFRIDGNKGGRATGQDFVTGVPDLAGVGVPAPFDALLLGSDGKRLAQRNRLEVFNLHGTGESQHVAEFIHLAHGFIQDGGDDSTMRVSRRPGEAARKFEMADSLARIFVQRELEPHTLRIVMAAAETMVLARLGLTVDCVAVREFVVRHG